MTISRHPAPTGRPEVVRTMRCQWAKSRGSRVRTPSSQARALIGPAPQSFELAHRPSNQVLVDALCEEVQLGAVKAPVVADPAPYLRIDILSETGQIRPAPTPEVPVPDLLSYRLPRLGAHGRIEAHKVASRTLDQACPEGIAEEIEAGVLRVPRPVRVLAKHDLRLLGMQFQTQRPESARRRRPEDARA